MISFKGDQEVAGDCPDGQFCGYFFIQNERSTPCPECFAPNVQALKT